MVLPGFGLVPVPGEVVASVFGRRDMPKSKTSTNKVTPVDASVLDLPGSMAEWRDLAATRADTGVRSATFPPHTRAGQIEVMLRADGGATIADLAEALGWQQHSVRGFISGNLRKHAAIEVVTVKIDGIIWFSIRDRAGAGS